ncbi:transporter substrate-binding domain-containing protein [Pandoraea pnomenusa]|uniref:transporter substrate-binding domain-containing protein n=1 Tax=Pandoraea pnomenusa TaxID=93220 RepID=UPI003341422B
MENGTFQTRLARAIALCSLLGIWSTVHAADLLPRIMADGVLRVANTQSSPPWSLLDEKNQPAGYDVEIAKEVARRMGVQKVVFIADSGKNFIEGLKAGKYDVVMNDLTPTTERSQQVDFGTAYGAEDFRIFVRNDNTSVKGRGDLKGKRVGVTTGSSNESWARRHLATSELRSYDNGGLLFSDLANGRVDAVIVSHFGGLRYATVNKLPLKEVGEPLTYELSAPALAKHQPALTAAVNKAIGEMLADGTVDRLAKQWVSSDFDMRGAIAKANADKE